MLLLAGADSLFSGLQSGIKQQAYNTYAQKMKESLNKSLIENLALLQQQMQQYSGAEQQAITERLRQLNRELGLVSTTAAAAGIKGNSLLRQQAVAKVDASKDIGIRQTNIRNTLKQTIVKQRALKSQTQSQILQLLANRRNPVTSGVEAAASSFIQWLPTIANYDKKL